MNQPRRIFAVRIFAVLFICPVLTVPLLHAASLQNSRAQLQRLQQDRQELVVVRKKLEARLGVLGVELKGLDELMVAAVRASRAAGVAVDNAEVVVNSLQKKHLELKVRVTKLRKQILNEASAAFQRLQHAHWFVLVLSGVSVTETPHRQYLLSRLLASQAADRDQYVEDLQSLQRVKTESIKQLSRLEQLHGIQAARKKNLVDRLQEKRGLWKKTQRNISLKREKDRAMLVQEKALKELIEQLHSGLSKADASIHHHSMRARKGRLPWPIKSRVVTRFRKKPGPGRPRLAGVQLAPIGANREIKTLASGQIRYADWFGGYGLMMIIDHGDGIMSVYAHNDALYKQIGDWVEDGEIVALAGSTGWVKRPLLYFEIRVQGKPVNPLRWCRRR